MGIFIFNSDNTWITVCKFQNKSIYINLIYLDLSQSIIVAFIFTLRMTTLAVG